MHPRFRTPHLAIVAQAIWSSVLVLTGTYGALVTRVIYTEWIFFGALALGTIALRRGARLRAGVSRLGYPVVPIAVRARLPRHRRQSDRVAIRATASGASALVAAGLPVYYVWRRLHAA